MFCPKCGKDASGNYCTTCGQKLMEESQIHRQQVPTSFNPPKEEAGLQTGKMVVGILSLVFSFWILFQSCAANIVANLEGSGDLGGSVGFLLVICWWIGGIIGIAARKNKLASIFGTAAYAVAALVGIRVTTQSFEDLNIYIFISIVFALVFGLSVRGTGKKTY